MSAAEAGGLIARINSVTNIAWDDDLLRSGQPFLMLPGAPELECDRFLAVELIRVSF